MADQKTVLVIEDEIFLSQLLTNRLKDSGINVVVAASYEEGLAALKTSQPNLVLLDIILPGKQTGFELLAQARQDPILKDIPFVIISNLGQETDVARGRELGVIEYFVKAKTPLDGLVEKIKAILEAQK
ncbi:MAG: response regulator [Candidatus Colwellbacteria bacterium]|nr:response regulator [Candidatus Colwellbacteria bacterium]